GDGRGPPCGARQGHVQGGGPVGSDGQGRIEVDRQAGEVAHAGSERTRSPRASSAVAAAVRAVLLGAHHYPALAGAPCEGSLSRSSAADGSSSAPSAGCCGTAGWSATTNAGPLTTSPWCTGPPS